jgi:hypothetical protein
MRDSFATTAAFVTIAAVSGALAPLALAQPSGGGGPMGATPLAVDWKKTPVGSWADYQMKMGDRQAKSRWALVDRTSDRVTLELSMDNGPLSSMGGKMTMRLVMVPDPTKAARPVLETVMQIEGKDPMQMPSEATAQKFEKPDPKKMVGKETVKVIAGSFATSHYRQSDERGTLDMWLSDELPPLGIVKLTVTPKAGSPSPGVELQLAGKGKDAKPTITKKPVPFDPAAMFGAAGGAGGPPPRPAPKQ